MQQPATVEAECCNQQFLLLRKQDSLGAAAVHVPASTEHTINIGTPNVTC